MNHIITKLSNPETFSNELMSVVFAAMNEILRTSASDEKLWKHRHERIKIHGLLNYATPSKFKPKEIVVDQDRLDDVRYRRSLIRQLKAPRPGKWNYHSIGIDRARILSDESYLEEMSKVLAYRWVARLLPVELPTSLIALLKQDVKFIEFCMDKLGPHQIDGDVVAFMLVRHLAEEALETSPTYIAVSTKLRTECAAIRADFERNVAIIAAETRASAEKSFAAITADANRKADEALVRINANLAATAASCQKALDESPKGDQETLWRAQLAARDEERRKNSKVRQFFCGLKRKFGF